MRLFLLACIAIAMADGSFINSMYPRFKHFRDDGDPGEALYLTEYIEKNDIENVSQAYVIAKSFASSCKFF